MSSIDRLLYTEHLCGYGLIESGPHGYSFRIEFLKQFLIEQNQYVRINLTESEKEQEVNERRKNIERILRKIIRNQLKAVHGKNAYDKLTSAIPESRRIALASKSLEELLTPDDSPLYLLDLINLINRQWDDFKNIFPFEKSKCLFMLEEINRLRKEAHSNAYTAGEFEELRVYFRQIENAINEWV